MQEWRTYMHEVARVESCLSLAGSPFDPVEYEGKKLVPGQANNVFIFPGVGFGSVMIKAKTVTDDMFIAAAKGLADYVSKEQIEAGNIYPEINDLRNISATVSLLCTYLPLNLFKKAFLGLFLQREQWLVCSLTGAAPHYSP